jgi:elongation factor P
MIIATQLRRGTLIKMGKDLFRVVDFQHLTPGKGKGHMQTKLKNIRSGSIVDHRFRSDETVERAVLDNRSMQYLYRESDDHYFMDTQTFEQIHFNEELLGDALNYLVADSVIEVEFFDDRPVGIVMPPTVDLKVVETEPGMPSATVSNVQKPAKTETGLVVPVPHFISEGEIIRVDTTEGKYVERVRA